MSDQMTNGKMSWTTIAAVLTAAGLLIGGCAGAGSTETPSTSEVPESAGLQNFDGCSVFEPQELQSRGLPPKGEPEEVGLGEVGCAYKTDGFVVGVYKSPEADRAYWQERRHNFDKYEEVKVGSHDAFISIAKSGLGQGICDETIYAGGGSVIVQFSYDSDQMAGKDPCAKAMEFAKVIEPRLPE